MPSRRQLLNLPLWLAAMPAVPATDTEELVVARPGMLPIILTAPHGGRMPVPGVVPRTAPERLPAGTTFVTDTDPETDRLAFGIAERIRALTRRDVYVVVARFQRRYIDANRAPSIAFDQPAAQPHYDRYHQSIRRFVNRIRSEHPHGLLVDIHGQHKFPDALVRGTINGRAVKRLIERAGVAAVTGPDGLFGQLERHGFRVFPANSVPPAGRNEDAGFNGGYTTNAYGSHRPDGIDAVQFEFGSEYRRPAAIDRTIERAADALVGFHAAYLRPARNLPLPVRR